MEQKPFPFAVCVKCCNLDNDLTIDQNYNSKSENAQSGKAVAEALSSKLDYKVGYESELDNYKDGSELYLIKGSHPETVGGLFEFNPYYLFVLGMGGIINTESGEPVITHTQYKFVVDGMYKRHYTVTEKETGVVNSETGRPVIKIIEEWTEWEKTVFESDLNDYKIGYISEIDNYKDEFQLYLIKGSASPVGVVTGDCYLLVATQGREIDKSVTIQYKLGFDGIVKREYKTMHVPGENGVMMPTVGWTEWESVAYASDIVAVLSIVESLNSNKANKPLIVVDKKATEYTINLVEGNNHIIRLGELEKLSVVTGFEKLEDIPEDYALNISFSSGETPTIIDYAEAYYVSWVGVDCLNNNRVSSFQPLGDKRYDVVFYKDGHGLVGLVNGYISSIPLPPPIIG